jgi:hypothetical protein
MKSIDGVLYEWGERWDWANRGSSPTPKQESIRIVLPKTGGGRDVRAAINSIIRKTPQAIVKISGSGKGARAIVAHIKYISRQGKVEVEDEQGNRFEGKEAVGDLCDSVVHGGGAVIPDDSHKREGFNIVLSAPPGSDRSAVRAAANAFARESFDGCQWVIAHHDDTAHPHAHLFVKAARLNGTRLNPRKAELARWRGKFAKHLRDNGISVEATPRAARLRKEVGLEQSQHHMRARGVPGAPETQAEARERARRTRKQAIRDLWSVHAALKKSGRTGDLIEARRLAEFLRSNGAYGYRDERHAAVAVELAAGEKASTRGGVRSLSELHVARPAVWSRHGVLQGHARDDLQR